MSEWLVPAEVATIVGTTVSCTVFLYLFLAGRERSLLLWSLAWLAFALRVACNLASLAAGGAVWLDILSQLFALLNGVLLLWGTFEWQRRPFPRVWFLAAALLALWIILTTLAGVTFWLLTLPTFVFLGVVTMRTGLVFLHDRQAVGVGWRATGWALIVWGLHKLDYPFLRPVEWFAPLGYLLSFALSLAVAIGIILIYFERAQAALRASEERYRQLVEHSPVPILVQRAGRFLYANQAALALHDAHSPEQLVGRPALDFAPPEQRAELAQRLQAATEDLVGIRRSTEDLLTLAGRRVTTDNTSLPVSYDGEPAQLLICQDITEQLDSRRRIERLLEQQITVNRVALALGESQKLDGVYGAIYERVRELMDADTLVLSFYDPARQLITAGYVVHEGANQDLSGLAAIPLEAEGHGTQSQVIRSGRPLYLSDLRPQLSRTQTLYYVGEPDDRPPEAAMNRSALYVPMKWKGEILGVLQVQSQRLDAYSADDMDLLGALANVAAGAIQNARLLEQTGRQARQVQQIVNSVPEGLFLLTASGPDSWELIMANPEAAHLLAALAGVQSGDELRELAGRPLAELLAPPEPGMWHELLAAGSVYELAPRPVEVDPDRPSWVVLVRDVTREREVQQRYQQQERLAAVGQLAAGISHDFNNIMAVIVLYSQMLRTMPELSPKARERLEIVEQQARRATDLILQILDFSRSAVLERRPLDLNIVLKEQVRMLRRTLPEDIEVTLRGTAGPCVVNADPTRIQQVVMNLAVNARDAMPEGGRLELELERRLLPAGAPTPLPELEPGQWACLHVRDSGTGIDPQVLPRIFDPFFTTKPRGMGSGLGLAQVHGIVKQHAGEVGVESTPGQGTHFSLYFPLQTVEPPGRSSAPAPAPPAGHGETILVVEDDEPVRQALVGVLSTLNYRVIQAADGRQALSMLAEVDLILSDLVMPRMGGEQLVRELRQRNYSGRIVLLTGHPRDQQMDALLRAGVSAWLQKPVDLEALAEVVARALAGP